jgi:hypothetical protein
MISKINKGEKFVCSTELTLLETNEIAYIPGKVYECIEILKNGPNIPSELFEEHTWGGETELFNQHFIPYTYTAVSAHYDTCKTMDEADPFAMLLLDLEPTLELSEACSCGEHSPNGIYNGKGEFGFVTQEQMKEVDKKINWRDSTMCAETLQNTPTPDITLPDYYDNSNGSLYKIAEQRGWGVRLFDLVKRLERNGKKDPLEQEIRKSIGVLELWLKEIGGTGV